MENNMHLLQQHYKNMRETCLQVTGPINKAILQVAIVWAQSRYKQKLKEGTIHRQSGNYLQINLWNQIYNLGR